MRIVWTEMQQADIKRLRSEGKTLRFIAERYNVTAFKIWDFLNREQVETPRFWTLERAQYLCRLLQEHGTAGKASHRYNIPYWHFAYAKELVKKHENQTQNDNGN